MAGFQAVKNWMARALGQGVAPEETGVAEEAEVIAAVAGLVAGGFTPSSSAECLRLMQAVERAGFMRDYYRYPFYYWKPRLSLELKTTFKETWLDAFNGAEDVAEKVTLLALAARIAPPNDQFATALNVVAEADWSGIEISLAEDLCGLLQAQRKYEILYPAADTFLKAKGLNAREVGLLCDFYVQAAYQRLKKKIFRNTLDEADLVHMRQVVDRSAELLGAGNSNVSHHQGLLACMEGDLDAAVQHHAKACGQQGYDTQFFRAGLNMVPLEIMRELADVPCGNFAENPDFYSQIRHRFRHGKGGDATLLACDEHYFNTYTQGFCKSYGMLNPGKILHIHAIGFEPSEETLDAFEAEFGIAINVSLDPGPAAGVVNDLRRGYCAGARYIHLPAYLDHYSRIIVNDIDGIVHRSFDDTWAGHEGKVMLSTLVLDDNRKGHFAFWSNIGAGAFGIENVPSHKRLAQALANYLTRRFVECEARDERFFFSDQVGLLLCVLAFRGEVPMVKMPQIFRQSTQTSQIGRDDAKKSAQSSLIKTMLEDKGVSLNS